MGVTAVLKNRFFTNIITFVIYIVTNRPFTFSYDLKNGPITFIVHVFIFQSCCFNCLCADRHPMDHQDFTKRCLTQGFARRPEMQFDNFTGCQVTCRSCALDDCRAAPYFLPCCQRWLARVWSPYPTNWDNYIRLSRDVHA